MDSLSCWVLNDHYWCQIRPEIAATHWLPAYHKQIPVELGEQFLLKADLQIVEGPPTSTAGLTFRDSDAGRYLFSIRADGQFRVSSIQDEPPNWINLVEWTPTEAIRPDEVNTLTVSADGASYALFINGQFVAEINDSLWQGRRAGLHLFSATGKNPALFIFDNYTVETQK
jgi:hypothetical protein